MTREQKIISVVKSFKLEHENNFDLINKILNNPVCWSTCIKLLHDIDPCEIKDVILSESFIHKLV